MILRLLGVHVAAARNSWRHSPGSRFRAAILAGLSLVALGGVWWASSWFFGRCLEMEPIGPLIIRRALAMVLLLEVSLLAFSSLVGAFSQLYLADDLQALATYPIPPESLYSARFVQTAVSASWMVIPFGLPVFITAGLALHADPGYWPGLVGVMVGMVVLAAAVGVAASLVITSVLSARRARHIGIAAGSLLIGGLAVIARGLRPEQLVHPNEAAPLLEALAGLQGLDPAWLPHSWALDALWRHLGPGARADGHPLLLLLTAAVAAFFVAGWLHRWLWPRAFSRAQEGLHHDRAATASGRRRARVVSVIRPGSLEAVAELARKDRRTFVRDTAQWSQAVVLVAIVAVYVLNFSSIRAVSGAGLVTALGVHVLNLGLAGFVVLALGARFVFPAVSLEGPAFWLLRSAPLSVEDYLRAKTRMWTPPLLAFGSLLVLLTQRFLGAGALEALLGLAVLVPVTAGLVAVGTGLGARFPRFDADDPAAVATGFGGLAYMLIGSVVLVVTVAASVPATAMAMAAVHRGRHPGPVSVAMAVVGSLAVVILPWLAGRWSLQSGRRRLERGEDADG
jgi:ABC-2 type transport system permease protein